MEKEPGKRPGKVEPEKVPKKGRVRHVHQDHESAYSNGRRSTLPDRHVFELAEVRENGKGYGKAHHSGTEKRAIRSIQEILSMRSRARKYTNRKKRTNGSCPCSEQR